MQPLTQILDRAAGGDPAAAEQLLPLVYDELRRLAKAKAAFTELEQTFAKAKYGLAASNYLSDWMALQLLIPEAERLLASQEAP